MWVRQINMFCTSYFGCSNPFMFSVVSNKSTVIKYRSAAQQYQCNIHAQTWTSIKSKTQWEIKKVPFLFKKMQVILVSCSDIFWLQSLATSLPVTKQPPLPCRRAIFEHRDSSPAWTINSLGSQAPGRAPKKARDMTAKTMDSFNTAAQALWGVERLALQILWAAKWSTSISCCLNDDMWHLGPLMGFGCCLACRTKCHWLTEQNECLNPQPLHSSECRVLISILTVVATLIIFAYSTADNALAIQEESTAVKLK